MGDENVIISVQVPADVNAWLEAQAERDMTTKSAVVRRFIAREIERCAAATAQRREG